MYSVVLMAALTTSVDLPDRRGGCSGGCYGGCYGGCRGGRRGGCHGCYGGCYGCYGGMVSYGCCGCYGGVTYYGGCHGGMMMPPGKAPEKAPMPGQKKKSMLPAPATIVVELPADAKLLIDNEATTSTGNSRVFQSPALSPDKEYHYTLKAEIIRDGKPIKIERVVEVTAGNVTPVRLTLPAAGVAQH